MTQMVKSMFGGSGTKGLAAQQRQQQAQIEAESRRMSAIEEGQRKVRGGGAGLLAFMDEKMKSTFGG